MEDRRRDKIMEIYKLHAELADRVSQRRMSVHGIYVSVLAGLLAFFGSLLGLGRIDVQNIGVAFCAVGIAGMLLASSWDRSVRSYRKLSEAKFEALHEIEKALPFQFFMREWDLLKGNKYVELTKPEAWLPRCFLVLYLLLLAFGVYRSLP